jgi:F-type H+-transporting ATPase subunit b
VGIDINNYLRINPVDMILVCASTLLLVLVAKRFFWDVVINFFYARQKFIQDEIDAGQQARLEGEAFKQ